MDCGSVAMLLALAVGGLLVWSQVGVMPAEAEPLQQVRDNPAVSIEDAPEGIVLSPTGERTGDGIVFIPGAKVDPWAYAPILSGVVAEGTTVVITRPWLNLAFFDPRGLGSFTSAAPEVTNWAVGGHSLGGVRGCQMASEAQALVLFASYCATDLARTGIPVLSISGSEDGLSTPEKIADARSLLPADAELVEIDGAAHASFGDYGVQAGDGTATLTDAEMHATVTRLLTDFLDDSPR